VVGQDDGYIVPFAEGGNWYALSIGFIADEVWALAQKTSAKAMLVAGLAEVDWRLGK